MYAYKCGNVCDQHDHKTFVFWFLSNISAQQMCLWWRSPELTYHKQLTRVAVELKKLQPWRPLAGCCCGVDISVDSSSWEIRNEQNLAWKAWGTFSLSQFERNKLKGWKEMQNSLVSRISSFTKKKRNSVRCRAWDLNLGPLVYEASVLPTELSFWMKTYEKLLAIYAWFVVQQM